MLLHEVGLRSPCQRDGRIRAQGAGPGAVSTVPPDPCIPRSTYLNSNERRMQVFRPALDLRRTSKAQGLGAAVDYEGDPSRREVTRMALRLTTASAPKTVSRSPAELAALARTYLLRGDLDGYKKLFAAATGDSDPHRR